MVIRITSTSKIAHKKRGLDSLSLAFYVGVMYQMKLFAKYIVGVFPVIALLSLLVNNPYLSILLISLALIIAIPVTFFAIKALALGSANKMWAITSLCCSSTAALLGVLVILSVAVEFAT